MTQPPFPVVNVCRYCRTPLTVVEELRYGMCAPCHFDGSAEC